MCSGAYTTKRKQMSDLICRDVLIGVLHGISATDLFIFVFVCFVRTWAVITYVW